MHNTLFVAMVNALDNLLKDMASLLLTKEFLFYDHIKEFTSLTQLCYQVDIFGIYEILVELQNIRVVQSLQNFDLIFKSLFVFDLFPWNCFACSDLLRNFMLNPMNYPICPRTKHILFVNLVAS